MFKAFVTDVFAALVPQRPLLQNETELFMLWPTMTSLTSSNIKIGIQLARQTQKKHRLDVWE